MDRPDLANLPHPLIDGEKLAPCIKPETRQQMAQIISTAPFLTSSNPTVAVMPPAGLPAYCSALLPALIEIKGHIQQELENNLSRLTALNRSRREAVVAYLNRLSGHTSGLGSSRSLDSPDSPNLSDALSRWIQGPRSPSQNSALQTYFEEVALIALGQALLLKAWSDREVRKWSINDLKHLNHALNDALKSHVPLDRDGGWQITRQNLYSWYNPNAEIQQEIWTRLDAWRITNEGPHFLTSLLEPARQAHPESFQPKGYDSRFFTAIWENIGPFGFAASLDSGPIKRSKIAFSPTLRDGAMVRTGPTALNWIGLESSLFQLILGELVQLWWGPATPPLWAVGNGLEVHSRDQLAFGLSSPKPSLISRITEMEACDIAFVLEEQLIRGQSRSLEANAFREQADALPYFKKLRKAGTTLGDLQACVALNKLRPNGLLWWAREEPLSAEDGTEMLNFVLDRAKIVCEWDFSELDHSLPASIPLFPKHLYLLCREPRLEERLTHRPVRLAVQGQIRSHIEIPLFLEDALRSFHASAQAPIHTRGQWKIHTNKSPSPQKDWAERWPDPACQNTIRTLDRLKLASLPLANIATVSPTPKGDPKNNLAWSVDPNLRGFWIEPKIEGKQRRLVTQSFPLGGEEITGSGFIVVVSDERHITPLSAWLESEMVRQWLDHNAERKGERPGTQGAQGAFQWVLTEQLMRWIPIPKSLVCSLGALAGNGSSLREPEPPFLPKQIKESLARLTDHAPIYVRAAKELAELRSSQDRLLSVVTADGKIRWSGILDIIPKSEFAMVSFHPKVKISGNLPPHVAIGRMERVKSPSPGILLATEAGFNLLISSESTIVLDMLWEQLKDLAHPTWSELLSYLRLPRRIEMAEAAASDVLRSHGETSARIRDLVDLLSACSLF